MQLLRFIPLLLFLLIKVKTLFAKDVFWSDRIESQLLQSMFLQAYKGKWFPMSNKTIPFDEFMLKGGRLYKDGDNIPFTGWYAQYDEREEPRECSVPLLMVRKMDSLTCGMVMEPGGFRVNMQLTRKMANF